MSNQTALSARYVPFQANYQTYVDMRFEHIDHCTILDPGFDDLDIDPDNFIGKIDLNEEAEIKEAGHAW